MFRAAGSIEKRHQIIRITWACALGHIWYAFSTLGLLSAPIFGGLGHIVACTVGRIGLSV